MKDRNKKSPTNLKTQTETNNKMESLNLNISKNFIKCKWPKHTIKRQQLSECIQCGVKVIGLDEVTQGEYAN